MKKDYTPGKILQKSGPPLAPGSIGEVVHDHDGFSWLATEQKTWTRCGAPQPQAIYIIHVAAKHNDSSGLRRHGMVRAAYTRRADAADWVVRNTDMIEKSSAVAFIFEVMLNPAAGDAAADEIISGCNNNDQPND